MKKAFIFSLFIALALPLSAVQAGTVTFGSSGSNGTGSTSGLMSQTSSAVQITAINGCVSLPNDLRFGLTNGEVTLLQTFLNSRGFLPVTPTGYFGSLTLSAVRSYQMSRGIPSTGFVGPTTRAQIQRETCGGQANFNNTTTTSNFQNQNVSFSNDVSGSSVIGINTSGTFVDSTNNIGTSNTTQVRELVSENDITARVVQINSGSSGGGGVFNNF